VGVGLAGGFLEPLESTSIFLIQAAVMDLINLMPTQRTGIDPRLAAEFNRLFEVHYDRSRDFIVLHYLANRREGALWDHVRTMALPDSLQDKIELFRASAAAPDYRYGLFSRDSWLAVLVGQGIEPRAYNPLAEAIPLADLEAKLADLKYRIDVNAEDMTKHGDFIRGYCPAPALEPAA
jgi:tryptophan halogenase